MARRVVRGRARAEGPKWPWFVALGIGLATLGRGLWLVSTDAPTPDGVADPGLPELPGGMPVSPGELTLDEAAPDPRDAPAATARCSGCDIVLITVCSLRRDHVGAYAPGAPADPGAPGHASLTPAIDAVGEGGFRFDRAIAASNFTLAGLTAILTGRYGSSTGVTGWDKGLVADIPTLPEVLGLYGWRTAAFTVDAPSGFRPDYGLDRGFQHMNIVRAPRDTPDGRTGPGEIGPGGASAAPVEAWLATAPTDRPMFLMFHTRTAHFPFVIDESEVDADTTGISRLLWEAGRTHRPAPGGAMPGMAGGTAQQGVVVLGGPDPLQVRVNEVGAPAVAAWRARYGEAVGRMDIDVQRVTAALRARGRLDRTIFVVVSDHGESLYDHGELLHGDAYYDSVVNVPLVMKVPGMAGRAEGIPALVSHVDLLPTLLELVGAVAPEGIDGASLVPLLDGTADAVRDLTLVEGGVVRQTNAIPRGAVISREWSLLRQDRGCGASLGRPRAPGEPATCLYDLAADPAQDHDLARTEPEVVDELVSRWDQFRAARAGTATQLTLDPAFVEELHRSGYDFRAPKP